MKNFLLGFIVTLSLTASAQSPGLSVLVKMDSLKTQGHRYKIEMNICEPKKMTVRADWFTHDTSKIDFASLRSNDIKCGGYFEKGTPTLISGKEEKLPFNQYEFSGQVFAWEKVFIFKISDWSSRGWNPEMYIVMPMKYKSFVTHITLNNIEFQSGKVIFLINYNASYNDSENLKYLDIDQSLKNQKDVDVKSFPLKNLLE